MRDLYAALRGLTSARARAAALLSPPCPGNRHPLRGGGAPGCVFSGLGRPLHAIRRPSMRAPRCASPGGGGGGGQPRAHRVLARWAGEEGEGGARWRVARGAGPTLSRHETERDERCRGYAARRACARARTTRKAGAGSLSPSSWTRSRAPWSAARACTSRARRGRTRARAPRRTRRARTSGSSTPSTRST